MKRKRPRRARISQGPIPAQPCPACGAAIEAVTGAAIEAGIGKPPDDRGPVRPEAGRFVICAECLTINIFGDDLRIRLVTAAELREAGPLVHELREWYLRDRGSRRPRWQ